jgi:DNA polymerase-3 subunit epsilon
MGQHIKNTIMKQTRPLVFIDTETTGTNTATDRVVSLAIVRIEVDGSNSTYDWVFNPERPIPPEATKIHGITDAMVSASPSFGQRAIDILGHLKGCDLAGFCCRDFDIPLLWEEFYRSGIAWDLQGVHVIDAGVIFKKKEERTLSAALKFYCNRDHTKAHGALADAQATADVFERQMLNYTDLGAMPIEDLATFCAGDEQRIDLAGKIVRGKDGRPAYAIGKAKGVAVVDDRGFGQWMLRNDFGEQTKMVLRALLKV